MATQMRMVPRYERREPVLKGTEMKREDVFPSRWLKAADLEGKKVRAIIGRLEMQEMGDDGEKPVLFFTRAQNEAVKNKGLVLNSTNWESIELMHGPESDDWLGKEITLYATKVPFRGKMTDGIRIEYQSTF